MFLLSLLLVCLSSCASSAVASSAILQDARESFLYLEKKVKLQQCPVGGKCLKHEMNSMASGFVIKVDNEGAYALTAAHFCDTEVPPVAVSPPITHKDFFTVTTLKGDEYKATVLASDMKHDICLLYVEGLTEIPVIRIATKAPAPGDKVYNVAAPRGIWQPNMVPLFEGIYNGSSGKYAFYSLPANPGSSGSMILNEKGHLIGVLHSVYIRFPEIALSSRHRYLLKFIKKNVKKYVTYKSVMRILDLKNLFKPPEETLTVKPIKVIESK
jgi:S1-C subfamily serine protease